MGQDYFSSGVGTQAQWKCMGFKLLAACSSHTAGLEEPLPYWESFRLLLPILTSSKTAACTAQLLQFHCHDTDICKTERTPKLTFTAVFQWFCLFQPLKQCFLTLTRRDEYNLFSYLGLILELSSVVGCLSTLQLQSSEKGGRVWQIHCSHVLLMQPVPFIWIKSSKIHANIKQDFSSFPTVCFCLAEKDSYSWKVQSHVCQLWGPLTVVSFTVLW